MTDTSTNSKPTTHCFIPGCTAIAEWHKLLFFKMSFGDLPHWWKSTAWVAKYNTELPANALICERHFEERFIDRTRKKPRLMVGTIPTLNLASLEVDNKNSLEYFCRLCAKKGFTPMRYRLEHLDEMSDVVQCCLGRFQSETGLPTGVCETCINTMKKFSQFLRECEDSQMQLLQLHTTRNMKQDDEQGPAPGEYSSVEANKENTDSEEQFESKISVSAESHGLDDSSSSGAGRKKSKLFADGKPCPDCGKLFKTHARYYLHVKSHNELLEYGCQICGKNFTRRTGLRRHLENVHGGKMKFKCIQCGETFTTKGQLRTHHRKVHSADGNAAGSDGSEQMDVKPEHKIEPEANTPLDCEKMT